MAVGEPASGGEGQFVGGVEGQGVAAVLVIDMDVALTDGEAAEDELGDGLDDVAVDDALELAGSVFGAGAAFGEKAVGCGAEDELEGGAAEEGRTADTDGNPETRRETLDAVHSWGASGELAWMLTGQRRGDDWPVEEGVGVEVAARDQRRVDAVRHRAAGGADRDELVGRRGPRHRPLALTTAGSTRPRPR